MTKCVGELIGNNELLSNLRLTKKKPRTTLDKQVFSQKCELLREVYASKLFEMFLGSYKPFEDGLYMDRYIFRIGNPYVIEVLKFFCDNWPPSIKKFLQQRCKNSYGHSIMKHTGEDVYKGIFKSAREDVIKTLSRARILSSEQITPMEILMMIYVSYVNESAQIAYDKNESIYRWEFEGRTQDWLNHKDLKHVQMFQLEDDNKPFNMNEYSFDSFLHQISLSGDEYQSQHTIMQSQHPLHHEGFKIHEQKVVNFYAKYLKEKGINLDKRNDDSTSEEELQSDDDQIFTTTNQKTKLTTAKCNISSVQQSKKKNKTKLVKKNPKRNNNKSSIRIEERSVTNQSFESVPCGSVSNRSNDEIINNENQGNESTGIPKEIVVTEKNKNDKMINESDHDESVITKKNSVDNKRNGKIFNSDDDETSIIDSIVSKDEELQDNDNDKDGESGENNDNTKYMDGSTPSDKSNISRTNTKNKDTAEEIDNDNNKQETNTIEQQNVEEKSINEECVSIDKNSNIQQVRVTLQNEKTRNKRKASQSIDDDNDTESINNQKNAKKNDTAEINNDNHINQEKNSTEKTNDDEKSNHDECGSIDNNSNTQQEQDSIQNKKSPNKRKASQLMDEDNDNESISTKHLKQRQTDTTTEERVGKDDEKSYNSADHSEDGEDFQQEQILKLVSKSNTPTIQDFSEGEDIVQVFMALIHKNATTQLKTNESLLLFSLVKEFREVTNNQKLTKDCESALIQKYYGEKFSGSYTSILKEC